MGSYGYLRFQSNTIQSPSSPIPCHLFFITCLSLFYTEMLALRSSTWFSTYTEQAPSLVKSRNLTGMDWGWCNRKRALLDAALCPKHRFGTCAGLFLFRSDCVCFWTTFSTSLSSSLQSRKHPHQIPALQRYRNTEAVRALLEYDGSSSTYKKSDL